MKRRGTKLAHDGDEFLFVEEGFNADTRAVMILARGDSRRFGGKVTLSWPDLGGWHGVARWTPPDAMHVPNAQHREHETVLRAALAKYRERRPAPAGEPRAWAVRDDHALLGELDATVPMGVAAVFHDERRHAEARGEPVPVDDVAAFLTHVARAGFGGALHNGTVPVFFCVDDEDQIQFLRVSAGEGGPDVDILDEGGDWRTYEGAEEIEVLDNQEACDALMTDRLGAPPLVGWPPAGRVFAVGPRSGDPAVLGEDGDEYGALFTSEDEAFAFLCTEELDLEVFPVDDVHELIEHDALEGCFVAINPGAHRARTGFLWNDGERTVLESFSGFWQLTDAGDFRPID